MITDDQLIAMEHSSSLLEAEVRNYAEHAERSTHHHERFWATPSREEE